MDSLGARMGFVGCICYPCKEGSQGLAMFWVEDVPVRLRTYSPNHIDADVGVLSSYEIWRITGIYGVATRSQRNRTWDLLPTLASDAPLPWLVLGDFRG